MEFKKLYDLVSKAIEYEDLLKEDNQRKKQSLRAYYQEVKHDRVVTEVDIPKPQAYRKLVKMATIGKEDNAKKSAQGGTYIQKLHLCGK